jgi:sulfatase modifying factor 1
LSAAATRATLAGALGLGALAAILATVGCGASAAAEPEVPADGAVGSDASVREASAGDAAAADSTVSADARADAAIDGQASPCPSGMIHIQSFCVDRYEGYVVDLDPNGNESPHSPYDVIGDASVRAKAAPGVVPQGYISQIEATAACMNAGKRLCTADEFALTCRGPDPASWYPYGGEMHEPGDCNEGKGSMMPILFGSDPSLWTYDDFNDPRLNQIDGGLAPSGSFPKCVSPYGAYDCVGNLHEWGSDPADPEGHGRFRGGFYGDAEENGHGCLYVTSAHELAYHDYSTGFRCCSDALSPE